MSRAKTEVFLEGLGNDITSPYFDKYNSLHFLLSDRGEVCKIDSGMSVQTVQNTGGSPSSGYLGSNNMLYVTDSAQGSVLAITPQGEQNELVSVYEDRPLKGPSSIVLDKSGNIFFTDSGPLGDTGLHNPSGSLFMISGGNSTNNMMMLKPISLENLAYPSDIALSNNDKMIYVTEMMTNRLLRFFQKPEGVYHGHVLYQNQGGIGPSCVAVDPLNGNIYVGIYDVKESSSEGTILLLDKSGRLIKTIITKGPEISGMAINKGVLYITERTTGSIQKFSGN